MSFTIRQTTQRIGGGDIVRTRTLELDSLVIGRGTDCDIQLTDLAVSLRHARMTPSADGTVTLEALGEESFEVDGRFVSRATVRPASRPRLVFGAHVLTLEPGASPGELVVDVRRLESSTPIEAVDDAVRDFSPAAVGPSRRGVAWTLGVLITVACLLLPVWAFYLHANPRIHADQQWSSGPLSHAHAFLGNNCQACHQQAFVAVRDAACQSCHQAGLSAASLRTQSVRARSWGSARDPHFVRGHAAPDRLMRAAPLPSDLRGKLDAVVERSFNHPETRCASCHREHLDADGKAVPKGARNSSIPDKPALTVVQDCAQCHSAMRRRLPDTGLADVSSWTRHPDFRAVVAVSLSGPAPQLQRIPLSQGPTEKTGLIFSHRQHLDAGGGVARMAMELGQGRGYGAALDCANCHRPEPSGRGFLKLDMPRDCGACHSLAFARTAAGLKLLPHGHPDQVVAALRAFYAGVVMSSPSPAAIAWSRRLPGQAAEARRETRRAATAPSAVSIASVVRAVFSAGGACHDCHTVLPPTDPAGLAWRIAPVRVGSAYLPRGGFDHSVKEHRIGSDGRQLCADCHKVATSDRSEDLSLPRIARCAACHGAAPGKTRTPAASDCAECHSYHAPDRPERPVKAKDRWTAARLQQEGR